VGRTPGILGSRMLFSRRGLLTGAGAGLLAAPLGADVQGSLAALDPNAVQPTNTFAHIAYGPVAGGSWKTSFVFINTDTTASTVVLLTYSTAGSPMAVPVVGSTTDSQHTFTIPASGSIQVDLDENATSALITGWAGVIPTGNVRGQGIFKQSIPGRPDFEAVVPMLTRSLPACIIPFPNQPSVLAMAFDNTGGYVTSVAFANTATAQRTLDLEFVDQAGAQLYLAQETMAAHNQMAFTTAGRYPALAEKKGWMRVLTSASDFTALGFRFNPSGAFATWLPVLS
jgi:hypothetical protein